MNSGQYSLFGPSLNVDASVKAAMNQAARASSLSREQITDKMNELAEASGVRLNGNGKLAVATLEKWLNPYAREHCPTLRGLVVFCMAVGTLTPLSVLGAPLGAAFISEDEAKLLRRAQIEEEIKRLQREKKRLEADI